MDLKLQNQQLLAQKQILSPQMQQSLQVLAMNGVQLREYLYEQHIENVILALDEQNDVPVYAESISFHRASMPLQDMVFNIPQRKTVYEHLYEQLNIIALSKDELLACKRIISSLDPDGYLRVELQYIAEVFHMEEEKLVRALEEIRGLDPAGVGATSLADCLQLQLLRAGFNDPPLFLIVQSYLPLLADAKYALIAKELGLPLRRVIEYCDIIRSLRPYPLSFNDFPLTCVPDLIVSLDEGMLQIKVNDAFLPKLHLDADYTGLQVEDTETKDYISKHVSSARAVIHAVEMRRSTLMCIAEILVHRQRAFFLQGAALVPLLRLDIAEELGLHESTISRAVQGKTLLCKQGFFPLSYFFTTAIQGGRSAKEAREAVRAVFTQHPMLSDQEACVLLAEQGISISRRTVAKYRMEEGIPCCHKRIRESAAEKIRK